MDYRSSLSPFALAWASAVFEFLHRNDKGNISSKMTIRLEHDHGIFIRRERHEFGMIHSHLASVRQNNLEGPNGRRVIRFSDFVERHSDEDISRPERRNPARHPAATGSTSTAVP